VDQANHHLFFLVAQFRDRGGAFRNGVIRTLFVRVRYLNIVWVEAVGSAVFCVASPIGSLPELLAGWNRISFRQA
jgi:hypothetical protein